MVSIMESTHPIPPTGDELHDVERAAAAPFVEYPDLPWWWAVVAGAWFTAILTPTVLDWPGNVFARLALLTVLIAILGATVRWYVAQRGVMPSNDPRVAPTEIGRVMWAYYVGVAVVLVVLLALWIWAPPAVTLAAVFVLSSGGLTFYERRYRTAAARTRARLA